MSQRIKRSQKKNNASTFATGGHVVSHGRDMDPIVKIPQKATGDVPAKKIEGLAKASPLFKKIDEVVKPSTKAEEKKVIAQSTEEIKKNKTE